VSKLQVGNGLVRISAGMVEILLKSCSPEELQPVGEDSAEAGAMSEELQFPAKAGHRRSERTGESELGG
jgi:hypothetical protein